MGELIEFPKPKIQLTEEETHEYEEILNEINEAKTIRQIHHCRKRVDQFMTRIKDRIDREKN
jgi:Zn-dependent M32 family carboxypeptidase